MRRRQLLALDALLDDPRGQVPVADIARSLGVSLRTGRRTVSSLVNMELASASRGGVSLAVAPKAALLERISARLDISKLLLDSGEAILRHLAEPRSLEELEEASGLSTPTVYRALNRMMETGSVVKESGRYSIDGGLDDVVLLARLLGEEKEQGKGPSHSRTGKVVFRRGKDAIRRVPKGWGGQEGSLTAFSVFGRYGMRLEPEADFRVSPGRTVSAEDALVHSLAVARDKLERTHSAVFYALNREKIDLGRVRRLADRFGVGPLWMNLERYVRGMPVPVDLFLPWDEFRDRCALYGLEARALLPPPAYPDLFVSLAKALGGPVSVYLLGGENMRMRKIKQATKDVDLVVADEGEYNALAEALARIGYRPLSKSEIGPPDVKLALSGIFVREGAPRVDVFTHVIASKLWLIGQMVRKSEVAADQGNLKLRLLSNEDVFLLKSVTDREADDVDMIEILRSTRGFDWEHLLGVLYEEERVTGRHFCFDVLQSLDLVRTAANMRIPIYRKLLNHTDDQAILRALGSAGWMSAKEISGGIGDIREAEVRNRLVALVRAKRVRRRKSKGRVLFRTAAR